MPWYFPVHHQWANGLCLVKGHRKISAMANTAEHRQKNNHPKSSMASHLLSEIFSTTLRTLPNLPSLPFLLVYLWAILLLNTQNNEYFPHFQPPPLRYLRPFSRQTHSGHYRGNVYALCSFFLSEPFSLGRDSLDQLWKPDFRHIFRGFILFRIRRWRNSLRLFTHRKDYRNQR
jgi:hypothetical protein